MAKNAEKKYFLNPSGNDSFYNGDTATQADLEWRHFKDDYYAWTWGDALFVVINPFWYTTTKPYTTTVGGGETDANRFGQSLGLDPGADSIQLAEEHPARAAAPSTNSSLPTRSSVATA